MQQQIEDSERDAIFERLKTNPDNNKCFDCEKKNPKWSSVYLGIYLCLDCAGKHREYGPQISFARSLNLDTWNRRYITFMEQGGNTKALEYFRKQGLKTPYDYKGSQIQKYKQELTKKVDAILSSNKSEEPNSAIFASEQKPLAAQKIINEQFLATRSHSDKPTHGEKEKESDDPFANNIVINKAETKTKGFTVEFSKNKTGFGTNKGRLAAKKIDNIDLDSLTLNEDGGTTQIKNKFDMAGDSFQINTKSSVKEIQSKGNSPYLSEQNAEDKFKKFQNAKAISSDSFKNQNSTFDQSNARKFAGATAISSAAFFGEKEDDHHNDDEIDYSETAENVKEFFSNLGDKIRAKVANEWN